MKKLVSVLLGSAALFAASSAMAADISPIVVPGPVVVVAPPAAPGFSWTGLYVGVQIGAWLEADFSLHSERLVGQAGYNLEVGERFVVGAFGQAGVNDGFSEFEWAVGARAGVALGRVLVYTAASLTNGPNNDLGVNLAAGTEFALGNRISIQSEAGIYHDFGGGNFVDHFFLSTGINFRFGG